MQTAKRLDGINEYYFSQKLREIDSMNKSGANVINLGIGSPDVGSSRVDLQACKLEYSIVSPK